LFSNIIYQIEIFVSYRSRNFRDRLCFRELILKVPPLSHCLCCRKQCSRTHPFSAALHRCNSFVHYVRLITCFVCMLRQPKGRRYLQVDCTFSVVHLPKCAFIWHYACTSWIHKYLIMTRILDDLRTKVYLGQFGNGSLKRITAKNLIQDRTCLTDVLYIHAMKIYKRT
jgi:hypothetical protein